MNKKEIRPAANGTDRLLSSDTSTCSDGWIRCAQCGALKRITDMAPDSRRKNGRRAVCRDCRSTYDNRRYMAKREPILAQQRKHRRENPGVRWAASYRERAQRYGFTPVVEMLTPEDLIARWGNHCVYCQTGPFEQPDHVVPVAAHGYHILANVVPCCQDCNLRKRWAFDELAIRLYRSAHASGTGGMSSAYPSRK